MFCADIYKHFSLKLDASKKESFFIGDVSSHYYWVIKDILFGNVVENGEELGYMTGADMYLPINNLTRSRVFLPCFFNDEDVVFVSTKKLEESFFKIESTVLSFVDPKDIDGCRTVIELFYKAVEVSNKEGQPIFISV